MKPHRFLLLFAIAIFVVVGARAHGPGPQYVPIPRLIENLTAATQKNPKDAEGFYLLGRIHYFAFVAPEDAPSDSRRPAGALGVYGQKENLHFDSSFGSDTPGKSRAPGPSGYKRTGEEQLAHVRAAVQSLSQSLKLRGEKPLPRKPDEWRYASQPGLYELCLACALEDGAKWAPRVGAVASIKPTPEAWRDAAIASYWLAFQRARAEDLKEKYRFGKEVSEEAGASYRRLVEKRGRATAAEKSRFSQIARTLETLAKRPRLVTPIVFSLTPSASLDSLLQTRRVRFDLDGTGKRQVPVWPRPETAILCWDPAGSGKITSGTQLFGSSTWWLFWRDGYAALAALDDDRDGWLAGRELRGMALWFDRNGNGVSDPGEVTPIERTSVDALAVCATGLESGSPVNPRGLRLKDGALLPTWDWVATVSGKR